MKARRAIDYNSTIVALHASSHSILPDIAIMPYIMEQAYEVMTTSITERVLGLQTSEVVWSNLP
uniref:Bm1283 n=1 Tax=Brugia malayi TaxID=6279 RepID=A0A1I9G1V7_BRUMA|nr:Bm1283 [Brugia malayi]